MFVGLLSPRSRAAGCRLLWLRAAKSDPSDYRRSRTVLGAGRLCALGAEERREISNQSRLQARAPHLRGGAVLCLCRPSSRRIRRRLSGRGVVLCRTRAPRENPQRRRRDVVVAPADDPCDPACWRTDRDLHPLGKRLSFAQARRWGGSSSSALPSTSIAPISVDASSSRWREQWPTRRGRRK